MEEGEKNDIVGSLVDLSMDLERIDKEIRACEDEIEQFQRKIRSLRAKKSRILDEFNDLSRKVGEE